MRMCIEHAQMLNFFGALWRTLDFLSAFLY